MSVNNVRGFAIAIALLVIALAVRSLPKRQQLLGRVWGTAGAVVLRLVFIAIREQRGGSSMHSRSAVRAASKYYWHQCEELFRSMRRYISSSFNGTSEGVEPFEKRYQEKEDPWHYATRPYELTKYRQTLDLLPSIQFDRALECACGEGVFTSQLAERVTHLLGADISPTALRRAKKLQRAEQCQFCAT